MTDDPVADEWLLAVIVDYENGHRGEVEDNNVTELEYKLAKELLVFRKAGRSSITDD